MIFSNVIYLVQFEKLLYYKKEDLKFLNNIKFKIIKK